MCHSLCLCDCVCVYLCLCIRGSACVHLTMLWSITFLYASIYLLYLKLGFQSWYISLQHHKLHPWWFGINTNIRIVDIANKWCGDDGSAYGADGYGKWYLTVIPPAKNRASVEHNVKGEEKKNIKKKYKKYCKIMKELHYPLKKMEIKRWKIGCNNQLIRSIRRTLLHKQISVAVCKSLALTVRWIHKHVWTDYWRGEHCLWRSFEYMANKWITMNNSSSRFTMWVGAPFPYHVYI